MKHLISFLFTLLFINYLNQFKVYSQTESTTSLLNVNFLLNESNPIGSFLRQFANTYRSKRSVQLSNISQDALCYGCEALIRGSKVVIKSEALFRSLFRHVCAALKFEEGFVCDSLSQLFSPHLRYILLNTHLSSKEICEITLSQCSSHIKYRDHFWKVPNLKGEKLLSPAFSLKSINDQGYNALWLTDVHIDPYYAEGSCSVCREPLCCRASSNRKNDECQEAGRWGTLAWCDMPLSTIYNFFEHVSTFKDKIDYIMFTGDISPHYVWGETPEQIINNTRTLAQMFQTYLPGKPVIFTIGNHETSPVNMFPPPSIQNELSVSWLYERMYDLFQEWIPDYSSTYFKHGGYYYRDVGPQLRLIIINTNFCARFNFWLWYDDEDPGDQLKWLAEQLKIAKMKSKKVHILGHIPPDPFNCDSVWLHNYIKVMEIYKDVIVGQFFGHTHFDEFRVYYSEKQEVVGSALIGGSLTTYEAVNPNFKIVKVDPNGTLSDIITFCINLTKMNHLNTSTLEWMQEYSTRDDYQMESLSKEHMDQLLRRLQSDSDFFANFYSHYHRSSDSPKWAHPCLEECQQKYLAAFKVCDPILSSC